MRWWQWLW
uniref:Uncharacterized protein n=1 Tax=Arundo donax TaxID=35708 RepID=A0A0A9ELH9_ARUDO